MDSLQQQRKAWHAEGGVKGGWLALVCPFVCGVGRASNVLRRACYRRRAPVPIKRRTSDDRGAAAKGSDDEGGTPWAGEGFTAAGEAGTAGVEIASEWAASGAQACCLRASLCLTAIRELPRAHGGG